ncbi:dolichyl-phosphate-mannose-protein mannosyltransferase [bacterium BMS3Abin14]|nr:dolichyl-phosphate-mannose-protein mannosyltransferase [bacterium BMS3Abin14]
MKRSHAIALLIILTLFALGFRTAYNKVTRTTIQADARQYAFYAYNLYKYGVYSSEENTTNPKPDSFRSPGYPLFLELTMMVSGVKGFFDTARLWQAVLSSLMVPLVFLLGVRLGSGDRIALVASALTAASPHLVTLSSYILTETLFGFLTLVALILFVETARRNSLVWAVVTGIVSGFAYLTNEVFLFLPLLLILCAFFVEKHLSGWTIENTSERNVVRRPAILAVSILAIFLVFPAVWNIRNSSDSISAERSGSQRALNTMAHGSYPGFVYKDPRYKYFPYREDPQIKEYTSSVGNFLRIFRERVAKRPVRYILWYTFEKPYYLWSWNILQGKGDVYIYPVKQSLFTMNSLANADRIAMKIAHPVLMAACLGGIFLFVFQLGSGKKIFTSSKIAELFLVMLYITFIYTVFAPWPRYSVPFRPIFYLVASWSIASMWGVIRNRADEKLVKEDN